MEQPMTDIPLYDATLCFDSEGGREHPDWTLASDMLADDCLPREFWHEREGE